LLGRDGKRVTIVTETGMLLGIESDDVRVVPNGGARPIGRVPQH
jgi:hypothetical protein